MASAAGEAMETLGAHLLAELYDCDRATLDDRGVIHAAMLEAARRAGATVVADFLHRFMPHGVSGVVVIAESHFAIHTWPEHGYAAVDLFTCSEALDADLALAHLIAVLGCGRCERVTVRRGPPRTQPGARSM